MNQLAAPFAVLAVHRVSNYEAWKRIFDQHQPAREAAGCLGHHLQRGIDDPNMIYIYMPASDLEKARAFARSSDLAETMKQAGVEGQPTITFMKPKTVDVVTDRQLPAIIIRHTVEDFERWKKGYDGFEGFRRSCGIVGHAANQDCDDPKQVIVLHQANDQSALRAFLDSKELRDAMQSAGVTGEPEIQFVRGEELAEYGAGRREAAPAAARSSGT
jgi:quinol monooxygenase YgiN